MLVFGEHHKKKFTLVQVKQHFLLNENIFFFFLPKTVSLC